MQTQGPGETQNPLAYRDVRNDVIDQAQLEALTDDVVHSSEIEGEDLPEHEVRSSIARQLDMKNIEHLVPSSSDVDSIVKMMTDATTHYDKPLLTAGIAHFWFVTIHPFDDGNGRIARAIADTARARAEQSNQRYYSMSKQILKERNDYYKRLEFSQKSELDITQWLEWFLNCLIRAIDNADATVGKVLHKASFWQRYREESLNERQIKVLNRVLEGFEGKLTQHHRSPDITQGMHARAGSTQDRADAHPGRYPCDPRHDQQSRLYGRRHRHEAYRVETRSRPHPRPRPAGHPGYIWERDQWPASTFNLDRLNPLIE